MHNLLLANTDDTSPEHTALIFVSQSVSFNLATLVNFADTFSELNREYYFGIMFIVFILPLIVNYYILVRDKGYLLNVFKNSLVNNIVIICYLFLTYYAFMKSLMFLKPNINL
jgi:hypothetical protein